MARKIIFWIASGLIALQALLASFVYLSGNPGAVHAFASVGYPQQLRIILGIAKPLGAIALLVPGFPRLREWAYAGFSYAWVCAVIAHYRAHENGSAISVLVLLVLLVISYVTRPAIRQMQAKVVTAA